MTPQPKNPESTADAVAETHLPTAYQTVGPYFKIGLEAFYRDDLTGPNTPGQVIEIAIAAFLRTRAPN